jgi:flagellar motor switch protein FliN/FliY
MGDSTLRDKSRDSFMENKLQNSISTEQLCKEYSWYENTFPQVVQQSFDEFFEPNFKIEMIGLSKNINCLIDKDSCFVTKIKLNHEYDMFFRLTDVAIDIILNKVLGQSKNKFNINKISELEAKVITSFNDYMFKNLKTLLSEPPQNELKRGNFDTVHLTFVVREVEEYNKKAGKIIVSLPLVLISPEMIETKGEKYTNESFPTSTENVKVIVGKTKISLYDLKNLATDDVVVFDDSNIEKMTLELYGQNLPINLNPNMDILITNENNGGDNMSTPNKNIWDSIEVDMNAEFDSVKVTLRELKDIEQGQVVDIASLYDNNVTLKVEDKAIASGTLVIVNDRYGVKINNVIADDGQALKSIPTQPEEVAEVSDIQQENPQEVSEEEYEENSELQEENEEEEFDYSDFELEDENI